ncbi:MAG TPA: PilT/PilU family type 4a pilus ATPase, partial [Polyangiaceae bacterium]|nr:PilT/PilU family type 4a pilus ATPase [Polyangiaceae bacterium]
MVLSSPKPILVELGSRDSERRMNRRPRLGYAGRIVFSSQPGGQANPYESEGYLQQLLQKAIAAGARDVHLKVGQPPGARVRGSLVFFRVDRIRPEDTLAVARHLIRDPQVLANLDNLREYDTAYAIPGVGRFRVNVYRQRASLAVVMRVIPARVPSLEQLGTPLVCRMLAEKDRGLVLCVGAAGNGKSTTLAAMIDHMNHTLSRHIVTIEDPIEYLYEDDRSSISQREIGHDTQSFASALRAALRQDPDVIQVGEIRDAETMEIALKAAETGHLVLSTLHTPDVSRTMNRIIALSQGESEDLRDRLADALQGIIAQRLLPRADAQGMVLAAEVLVGTGSVRETIRRPLGNPSLKELMESGAEMYGMQTFEMSVRQLVREG